MHTRLPYGRLWLALALLVNLLFHAALYAKTGATDVSIFEETFVAPWENWSYGETLVDFESNTAHTGTKGIAVTHAAANGALSVYNPTALSGTEYASISFWAFGAAGGSSIALSLGDDLAVKHTINIPAATWTHFNVSLSDLGNPASFQRINWEEATGAPQATYFLDEVKVVAATGTATPTFPDTTADGSRILDAGPSGVAVAPNGRVYVAVYKQDRVFSWPTAAAMTGGAAPDKTFGSDIGDPDVDCTSGPSATIMCGPESVAVDSNGNLFVADTYHHRVLVFKNPDGDATPLVADAVLGQPNLTSALTDHDSNPADGILEGFCFVRGVAVDASNRLWVVDEFNYRVVRFATPTVSSSLPDKVFGQADLDDQAAGCNAGPSGNSAANRFSLPLGVAVDAAGTLFVADFGNHRVQRFAAAAANGANAEASYTGLNQPHDVAVDPQGNLYVANTAASEVRAYGGGASGDQTPDVTYTGRNFPMGLAFTPAGDLLVADCGSPLANTTFPPCLSGVRGVYFFAAPAPATPFQPPDAVDDLVTTLANTAVSGNVLTNDIDPQGSALTVTNFTTPQNGTVTVAPDGAITFTPNTGFVGKTTFSYTASNIHSLSDTATVTINVLAAPNQPQPPNAVDDSISTLVNTPVSGNVLANDTDPQNSALTMTGITATTGGTVTFQANGDFTFTPNDGFTGQASFSYAIANAGGVTDTATVTIFVRETMDFTNNLYLPSLNGQND